MSRLRRRAAAGLRRLARTVERPGSDAQIVWLMGAPRTGSTWLSVMLRDHPRTHWLNEPLIGAHLGVTVDSMMADPAPDEAEQPEAWGGTLWFASRARPSYFFSRHHSPVWRPLLGDLLRARIHAQLEEPLGDGEIVVVKEPHGSEGAELVFAALPSSRLLFLVRDPRDCLDSSLAIHEHGWAGRFGGSGVLAADQRWRVIEREADLWRTRVEAVGRAYDRLPDDRRMLVRYEDLRAAPIEHLTRVLTWLGLPADPGWVELVVDRHAFDRTPDDQRGPGYHRRAATPGLWRENLLAEEKTMLAELLRGPLQRYGYDPSPG